MGKKKERGRVERESRAREGIKASEPADGLSLSLAIFMPYPLFFLFRVETCIGAFINVCSGIDAIFAFAEEESRRRKQKKKAGERGQGINAGDLATSTPATFMPCPPSPALRPLTHAPLSANEKEDGCMQLMLHASPEEREHRKRAAEES